MFNTQLKSTLLATQTRNAALEASLDAVSNTMAMIEFAPDGTILDANSLFLDVMGYTLPEVQGHHHRMLCETSYTSSAAYTDFWRRLAAGESFSDQFMRLAKNGSERWLEASYMPVRDAEGRITRIEKIATDITRRVREADKQASLGNAINRSLAMIEFDLQGHVLEANDNFLSTMGYRLDEIVGKHHRMFCEASEADSAPYRAFWAQLNRGEFVAGRFKRLDRSGKTVWLRATYNPLFDAKDRLYGVIKLATDVTEQTLQREAESQAALLAYVTAQQTDKIAQQGSTVVQQTVSVVQGIADELQGMAQNISALSEQSDRISAIVQSIRGIADQTNLLALNAAIEAARAGEHGRGFAVVADEVRNLAARTSQATVEIVDVVKQNHALAQQAVARMQVTRDKAAEGVGLATDAGGVIMEIHDGAQKVVSAIGQFSDTLKE
ncbi:PAS domain S-box protein [Pigmentiphaga aceris]|uniref:PAS domain S-box protein n=1 Tax=Pigmentiphaga aceris TaxID=1940612 RepID=A0A5C0B6D4_9BURK|nr:PAS domain-containing methyl-accepting chemotaxis protein [Pigmentiphaga aceris]QEI08980.1 PAS domain S-box protein [Pigmentiphaga aceris]